MKKWTRIAFVGSLFGLAALGFAAWEWLRPEPLRFIPIELAVSPGHLSQAHAFLQDDCTACHTPFKGVQESSCISCHATNTELLTSPTTAFHADVQTCSPCHLEHQGLNRRPTAMSHVALVRAGLEQLETGGKSIEGQPLPKQVRSWIAQRQGSGAVIQFNNPHVSAEEGVLDCNSCHASKGQGQTMHATLMGSECASCHATSQWTIAEFRHPSPRSTDCNQCHQAPPSHYMMHFEMVSQKVARQPEATVNQCYSCHQTNSWNDIKGVGWYDHH